MKQLIELFLVFARIGGFTFGGGYAMLPIIQEEVVNKRGWATEEEVIDYYAIGQITPGIIAINTATFIGYKLRGISGGIAATLGMAAPSVVIITLIAMFFENFANNTIVQHAFGGIRIMVVALIATTVYDLAKKAIKDVVGMLIFVVGFFLLILTPISTVWIIIAAALLGVLVNYKRKAEK